MAKRKRFAKARPDEIVMINYRPKIWRTDYHGTDMCNRECEKINDNKEAEVYCEACIKTECVRNINPGSSTQLWRNIQTINTKI